MADRLIVDEGFCQLTIHNVYIGQFFPPQPSVVGHFVQPDKVRTQKKITGLFGNFSHIGGRGLPNSQNFSKLTKYFFVCQIHSEVLKHVLQRGGSDIWSIFSPKVHLIRSLCRSFREKNDKCCEFSPPGERGGGVPYSQK